MMLNCGTPLDSIGYAVERLKSLGIPSETVVQMANPLVSGAVIVVNSKPKHSQSKYIYSAFLFPSEARWANVLKLVEV